MTIEEILAGESKNVEFKENLSEKSIKYMKSVVAFANGTGGKIIFGIADKTRKVIGFDKEEVFEKMDAIANAVSDSCEPAIIPDITLQTVDDKTIIAVEVSGGKQRPYYIKALGKEGGVYVRVAGTTRLADEYMIKELMFEGSNRYFDQTLCTGLDVTDEDIDALCKAMKEQAIKNAHNEEQKASVKDVGKQQLRSWGVLIERDGKDYPSNAYAILTGCGGLHVATQCGVFKGTTKEVFVDRREYTGPIWEQIEEAFQFVLRNIHLGATIVGIYRQDVYEIPPDAIRELIINAAVHRSYLDHGNIQVAVYDNRLEITSPGKLPMGQTLERMKEGYSQIRNEALAYAFSYMNLIEHWGSGIPRIIEIGTIRNMVDSGDVVIACGGGGIPVTRQGNHLKGASAVIDKDFASCLMAKELDADFLIILTAVEKVAINYGKPDEKWLDDITVDEAKQYIGEGHFAPGSMLPKVQAAVDFAESKPGRQALITLLEKAKDGILGKTGTRIHL